MPNLDLTDEKHAPLLRLVEKALDTDRYPLSPRLYPLRPILEKLEPQPMREPRPAPKVYAPPKATAAQRRRHAPATDRGPPDDAGALPRVAVRHLALVKRIAQVACW